MGNSSAPEKAIQRNSTINIIPQNHELEILNHENNEIRKENENLKKEVESLKNTISNLETQIRESVHSNKLSGNRI